MRSHPHHSSFAVVNGDKRKHFSVEKVSLHVWNWIFPSIELKKFHFNRWKNYNKNFHRLNWKKFTEFFQIFTTVQEAGVPRYHGRLIKGPTDTLQTGQNGTERFEGALKWDPIMALRMFCVQKHRSWQWWSLEKIRPQKYLLNNVESN